MIRWLRRTLAAAVVFVVVIGGVMGYLAWRLRREPITLGWLRSYVAASVVGAQPGLALTIGDIQLWWHAEARRVELRAIDVHLRHDASSQELMLPAVALHPRMPALLRGRLELDHLTLIAPRLAVLRTEDGVTLQTASTPPANQSQSAPTLTTPAFLQMMHDSLALLGSIEVRAGEISVDDRLLAHTWSVKQLRAKLSMAAGRVTARADGDVRSGAAVAAISLEIREGDADRIEIFAGLNEIVPADLMQGIPAASRFKLPSALEEVLAAVTAPITVESRFALGAPGQMDGTMSIGVQSQRFAIEDARRGLELRDGKLQIAVEIDAAGTATTIRDLSISFPETALKAQGKLTKLNGHSRLELAGSVSRFPVAALRRYWPRSAAPDARRWVTENITAGMVKDLKASLTLTLGTAGDMERFDLQAAFDDVAVRFAPAMPPATAVDGTVSVKGKSAAFTVQRGRLDELEISGGTVRISPRVAAEPTRIDVDVDAHGPLARAVALLDHDPVNLGQRTGVSPEELDGEVEAKVSARIPLGGENGTPAVFSGSARLDGVETRRTINGWRIGAGRFDVRLDGDIVQAEGQAEVATVPTSVHLRYALRGDTPSSVRLQAALDASARTALGMDLGERISGTIPVIATVTPPRDAPWSIDLAADLTAARISPPLSAFGKPAGKPGRIFARLLLPGDQVVRIDQFDINAGGTVAQGSAQHTAKGWETVHAGLRLPATRKSAATTVDLSARREDTAYAVSLRSNDASAVVDHLVPGDSRGGSLAFDGTIRAGEPDAVVNGRLAIHDLLLTRAPLVAQVLSLSSLTGLKSTVMQEGLHFERLQGDLTFEHGVVRLENGRGDGDAVVILAAGTFDTNTRQMDVRTSAIPSYYGLNTAAQKIPVLGPLVEKATGEAMQVIDARIHGSFDDPSVTIAPTSLVAPEILKEQLRSWSGKGTKRRKGR